MVIFITLRFFLATLLIDVLFVPAKSDAEEMDMKALGPASLVHFIAPILPEIEKFARLQAKLENMADIANLYPTPETYNDDALKNLRQDPDVQKITKECEKFHSPVTCSSSIYRSLDGSCNNLKHPKLGKATTEQRRLVPAYFEGTNGFRKSEDGEDLPSPRSISLTMINLSNLSPSASALFTFFGQFLAHDMSMTPEMTEDGYPLDCCNPLRENDFCMSVYASPNDPFFGRYNATCLYFARATPFPKCNFGKRGPVNKQTAFIDVSQVYGYSDKISEKIRTKDGTGKLRTQDTKHGQLMPKNYDEEALFCPQAKIRRCFQGGDDRANQHAMLISLETIFLRLHNNVADSFHEMNPGWDDDKVFQESRRIVIAMSQHIVYGEYLPLLLGKEIMKKYNLYPDAQGRSLYDDEVDPSVAVEFSTAAFRPHSMVPTFISSSSPRLKFRNTYSNFKPIHNGHFDSLLAGASELPSENNDEFQTRDMSEFLYKAPGETYGSDMAVTDIQRGRDLGLPTYTQMLQFCFGGPLLQDFSQLKDMMTEKNVNELRNIYKYVGDIDLLIGILRERRGNSVFSPTASCIASIQFHNLKFGDSFYFTHSNGRNPLSEEQLEFIKTYSLARIMCETTDIEEVRKYPLTLPSNDNPMVMCEAFPPMNLLLWKEQTS